ncbi:MAG: HD domain-containing protein [Pseudomonadales bacterium]|jgi:GTP pyrophosphokinase|nr:HD domain-containing protein [Pseudomonadales bacterium]MDP6471685.1 HD domain-containing protein [Pseudomonadales bacterium]MDP6970654.1 HD domain-containing protein [Pseudomonadales bacterium]|tara:strand:+ start:465 stop:2441 length:1977 start_codon:yes stop_codon:yes gene_type:complete
MVKVREDLPLNADGTLDVDGWARRVCAGREVLEVGGVLDAVRHLCELHPPRYVHTGTELAELVAHLNMDTSSVLAALYYRPVRQGSAALDDVTRVCGEDASALLHAVLKMADTSLLEMSNSRLQTSEARDQIGNVRSMLVALMDDGRVAVLKLAERVVALRGAKGRDDGRRRRIATEAAEIFAPLAGRLGIWQIKWELEDLALRYLEPEVYAGIAQQLDGRREERERRVAAIVAMLQETLMERGINALVYGRAKHIFSIWRKMRTKDIAFDQVYDVLAVRIIVDSLADCYAALGVIHDRWQHIPSEFDDYVASPKENGYRSIHTAVIGPDTQTFEVQIRTEEMHAESELGVCAHWSYKGVGEGEANSAERAYADKMAWLRRLLDWQESLGDDRDLPRELATRVREERIFVYTPGGHVLDLTTGATVLDFAYRVHTEVGHACVGARVNGQRVPLNERLESGQRVEIETSDTQRPRLEWLNPTLEYVHTARARDKIQSWFRGRDPARLLKDGRHLVNHMLDTLNEAALSARDEQHLASSFDLEDMNALLRAVAVGDVQLHEVAEQLFGGAHESKAQQLERFGLEVGGDNREGLLRDVTSLLSERHLSLLATSGRVDAATGQARLLLEVELPSLSNLLSVIEELREIPGIRQVSLNRDKLS